MNDLTAIRKMLAVSLVALFLMSALLIVAPVRANPGTLYVDAAGVCGGNLPCYLHPQDAVNNANPGDTILVYPGTYGHRQFTSPKPPHWGASDQYAPALIVFKDGLTIEAVDSDPSNTVIETTYNFWVNKALPGGGGFTGGGGSIEHSTGCTWNPTTKVWDGQCVRPAFGTPPNAISIIANGVTIDGFKIIRLHNPSIGGYDTVIIGGLYGGYGTQGEYVGYSGNTIKDCTIIGDLEIWHSSNNRILDNKVYNDPSAWVKRALNVYTGWSNAEVSAGPPSLNNQFIGNEVYNSWGGLFIGAWNVAQSNGIWTDNSGTVVRGNNFHDLTDFAVGFGFTSSGNVEISGNTMVNNMHGIQAAVGPVYLHDSTIDSNHIMQNTNWWGIYVKNVNHVTISNNEVRNNPVSWSIGVVDSNDVSLLGNDIINNAYGVYVSNSKGVVAHCNDIVGNGAGFPPYGPYSAFMNVPGAGDPAQYVVDARPNWWGDPSGPYHPTLNSAGLGDSVSDNVLFVPWKTAPEGIVASIDIKPGSWPNSVNTKAKGVLPVAILSSVGFDATQVDPTTVRLQGAAPDKWSKEDVNGDGKLDLILHFRMEKMNFAGLGIGEHEVTLTGTYLGFPFSGTDIIRIVK